jgi:hypothetical protein
MTDSVESRLYMKGYATGCDDYRDGVVIRDLTAHCRSWIEGYNEALRDCEEDKDCERE